MRRREKGAWFRCISLSGRGQRAVLYKGCGEGAWLRVGGAVRGVAMRGGAAAHAQNERRLGGGGAMPLRPHRALRVKNGQILTPKKGFWGSLQHLRNVSVKNAYFITGF